MNNSFIPEEESNVRGRNQAKRNPKQNSFEFMSPQPETKTIDNAQNRSHVADNAAKNRNAQHG